MTTTQTQTAGQAFAATIRRMMSIGPRTRRYRSGMDMQSQICERISDSVTYVGYDNPETTALMSRAFAPVNGYRKHVLGSRIHPATRRRIVEMTPWQFTAMLANMIDSGVSNMMDAEVYFGQMSR